jgi:hypothetical protein
MDTALSVKGIWYEYVINNLFRGVLNVQELNRGGLLDKGHGTDYPFFFYLKIRLRLLSKYGNYNKYDTYWVRSMTSIFVTPNFFFSCVILLRFLMPQQKIDSSKSGSTGFWSFRSNLRRDEGFWKSSSSGSRSISTTEESSLSEESSFILVPGLVACFFLGTL